MVTMRERRKNVRVRPAADYNVVVEYIDGPVTLPVQVMDLAIGGMGLVVDEFFVDRGIGDKLKLHITFPTFPRFVTDAEVRHSTKKAGGKCGILLSALSDEETTALRNTVAELQERGHSA